MSLLNDRATKGFIAGLIGSIPTTLFNQTMYIFGISKLRYLDFASVFVYGHKPNGTLEALFAGIVAIFFTAGLSIIFAYLVPIASHRNIVFKGFLFSVGAWFVIYSVTVLFKIPEISNVDLLTAVTNMIGASIWGMILGISFFWLDKKEN